MNKEFKASIRTIPTKNDWSGKRINRGSIFFGEVAVYANEPINESSPDRCSAILEADEIALSKIRYFLELKRLYKEKFTEEFCKSSFFGSFIHTMLLDVIDEVYDELEANPDNSVKEYESSLMSAKAILKMLDDMVNNLSKLPNEKVIEIEEAFVKQPNSGLIIVGRKRIWGNVYQLLEKYLITKQK